MIEYSQAIDGRVYLLDAEAATFHLNGSRDLGSRTFVVADVPVSSVYAGVLDGFLDWYHGLLGIPIPERQWRPRNQFDYRIELPDGDTIVRHRLDPSLGDIRVGLRRPPFRRGPVGPVGHPADDHRRGRVRPEHPSQ